MTTEPLLPGLIVPGEPLECSGVDLRRVIQEIEAQGFCVRRMDVRGASYTLHLQRKPKGQT